MAGIRFNLVSFDAANHSSERLAEIKNSLTLAMKEAEQQLRNTDQPMARKIIEESQTLRQEKINEIMQELENREAKQQPVQQLVQQPEPSPKHNEIDLKLSSPQPLFRQSDKKDVNDSGVDLVGLNPDIKANPNGQLPNNSAGSESGKSVCGSDAGESIITCGLTAEDVGPNNPYLMTANGTSYTRKAIEDLKLTTDPITREEFAAIKGKEKFLPNYVLNEAVDVIKQLKASRAKYKDIYQKQKFQLQLQQAEIAKLRAELEQTTANLEATQADYQYLSKNAENVSSPKALSQNKNGISDAKAKDESSRQRLSGTALFMRRAQKLNEQSRANAIKR